MDYSFLKVNERKELVELNKSLVETWYQYSPNLLQKYPTDWERLDNRQRFLNGGPWNSLDTLNIHLDNYNKFGKVIVMRDSKTHEMIGELEYHPFKLHNKSTYHIDWMMVHKQHQRMGIGSELLNCLKQEANQYDINLLLTEPEDGIESFYYENGFLSLQPLSIQNEILSRGENKLEIPLISDWNQGLSEFSNFLYGDSLNTPIFSRFLHKCCLEYAKLFGKKNKSIKWIELEDKETDSQIRLIRREVAAFNDRISLMITSDSELTDKQVSNWLTNTALSFPQGEYIFSTLDELKIPNWKSFKIIIKLQLAF